MVRKGGFVVFEGIDGAGTSTQLPILTNYIKRLSKYNDVLETHEPWRSDKIKKMLREDKDAYSGAEEMASLYIGDRISHVRNLIVPNLKQGVFVLSDRYALSTFAYQMTQGISKEKLIDLQKSKGLITPDITFYIRVSPETALSRIESRGEDREKFEQVNFLESLVNSYDSWVDEGISNPDVLLGKVVIIDGEKSINEVSEDIKHEFDILF